MVQTRLTDADMLAIARAAEPDTIRDYLEESVPEDRQVDLDKIFTTLEVMFDRAGVEPNPLRGESSFPGGLDFGEGVPDYHSPPHVASIATMLSRTTFDTLLAATPVSALASLDVYPRISWDDDGVRWLRQLFAELDSLYRVAAASGEHIVIDVG